MNCSEHDTTDNIIIYKEENGIVYGYFNQYALDLALFNRAKERTNNFTSKNELKGEFHKRAVRLDDISTQRHSVLYKPISNGEYIYAGNVILDIGLESLGCSNYFNENNISKYGTALDYGIRIFSEYSGYFENKIDDNIIGLCNLGNTVKDKDLLFTIQLSQAPEIKEDKIKEFKFDYKILDESFVKNIPYLSDIRISKWLIQDFSYINKDDDAFVVSSSSYFQTVKSPYSGILVQTKKTRLSKGDILFTIYPDELCVLENMFKYRFIINKDDFTKKSMIQCEFADGTSSPTYYYGFGMDLHHHYYIKLNLEYIEGKYYLLLSYDKKELKLDKNISLLVLLDNGNVLTLNPISKPIGHICRFQLSIADMDELETSLFTKWRIINNEGEILLQGSNICCSHIKNVNVQSKNISQFAFKRFINDFRKVVLENIPTEELEEQNENKAINTKKSCFVYLMIDTTNNFHKIGISNNPKYREHTLQSDKPTIELLCAKEYPTRDIAEAIESALHRVYANKRIRGEWFKLDELDIDSIRQTLK